MACNEAANVRPSDIQVIRIIQTALPVPGPVIDLPPAKPELAPAIEPNTSIFKPSGY
jgi:hypothetical protein